MKKTTSLVNGFQGTLEQKQTELLRLLRNRDGLVIEQSSDQMDFVQYAGERDMAIRTADRDYSLLREVKLALQRVRDGSFGLCIDCDEAINPKRLAALPWALRCIRCQEAADTGNWRAEDSANERFDNAA